MILGKAYVEQMGKNHRCAPPNVACFICQLVESHETLRSKATEALQVLEAYDLVRMWKDMDERLKTIERKSK